MSRRDTIIVAVLVNAGLLMILLTTAIKSDKGEAPASEHIADTFGIPDTLSQENLLDQYVSLSKLDETEDEIIFNDEIAAVELKEEVSQPQEVRYVSVTVKKGDFLEKIAKANNTTVAAIVKANNINPTQLKVGQALKVPIVEKKESPGKEPSLTSEENYYIVRDGDNPWTIASRNRIDLDTLLKLNDLDDKKAKKIRPGDRLRIR